QTARAVRPFPSINGCPQFSRHSPYAANIVGLRVCPKTSRGITEFSEHQADGGEAEEGEGVSVEVFPVLCQAAAATQPTYGSFDNPSFVDDDKDFGAIGTADDFGDEARHDARQPVMEQRS